jgi:4-hydroxy-tetrahydrodipicolinate synthase
MFWPDLITAIPTPFTESNLIDYDSLSALIDNQISARAAIVVFGTTGECVTLTNTEKIEMMKFISSKYLNYLNNSFVIGIGGNNTAECIEFMKNALSYGFTKFMGTTPYYNKPTQEGLVAHFLEIAKNMPQYTELILYNVPGRTGVNILPETIKKIADSSNLRIVGIKEASGNLSQMIKIREIIPNFLLFCGDDGLIIPAMSIGAHGLVSVAANVYPHIFKKIIGSFMVDNRYILFPLGGFELYLKYNNFVELLFKETSPSPVKTSLVIKGIFTTDNVRLPMVRTSDNLKQQLTQFMSQTQSNSDFD